MSTRFRINALEIVTRNSGNPPRREFSSGLNLIIGPPGSGKSTIIELIKFGLGLKFRKTPVVERKVLEVRVEIEAGTQELQLTRSTVTPAEVLVHDLITQEDIGAYPVSTDDPEVPTIAKRLLSWLGIRDDVSFTVGKKRDTLTFAHVWDYIHVPQSDIDQRIAHHDSSTLSQRRRRLFQLLFDMIDSELQELENQLLSAKDTLRQTQRRQEGVAAFQERAELPSESDLRRELDAAWQRRDRIAESLTEVRSAMGIHDDRVLTLQGLLGTNRSSIIRTQEVLRALNEVQTERNSRITELAESLDRAQRVNSSSSLLAPIEFSQCPRCMQSIDERGPSVPEHSCRLCLQDEPEPTQGEDSDRKAKPEDTLPLVILGESGAQEVQLSQQREELLSLHAQGDREKATLTSHLEYLQEGNRELRSEIELLTGTNGPHTEELSRVREALATAEAEIGNLENFLGVNSQINSFQEDVTRAQNKVDSVQEERQSREEFVQNSNDELLEQMSQRYNGLLHSLRTPNVEQGRISTIDYLPYIDDTRFDRVNISGGNQVPFIVGYWLTLQSIALPNPNYRLPSCLILDSPQKSLGPLQTLSLNLYKRIQDIADAPENPFQVFVVDTNLPSDFEPAHGLIKVNYPSPGIPGITHRGPQDALLVEEMEDE
ncbi:AAA family ATPase [Nocardiopsis sp. JB363]|uniref:AAA family ATPase n=1 Tax=Nocardiopsis sp. JB363 TaxID=1434837 RepID=UPI00097A6734|nr:AAA family ATPase [Nocardiopsis sp. JB363]SIO85595.1 hypothetical protein BQ8420_07745 [Nocardiopsis sp. JB363]